MGKLVSNEDLQKRRQKKVVPLVDYSALGGARLYPFSQGIAMRREQRKRRENLRLQIREMRKTLVHIGLPTTPEFMTMTVCFVSDQEEVGALAQVDQYRHLREYVTRMGPSAMEKYHRFAFALGKLGIMLPNFVWNTMETTPEVPAAPPQSNDIPDIIA